MSAGPTSFCGIELAHPIINASGTFDAIAARRAFGDAVVERFPFSAYVSKTITPAPRAGNPPPRLWEEPAAMVNSIGLPNKGAEGFLSTDLPALADLPVPLIVSVMATSAEEFSGLVEAVSARDEVAAIELNVSCPNVHSGLIVGEQPSETEALLEALRPLTAKPLIVKLTPNVAAPASVAAGAEAGGRTRCRSSTRSRRARCSPGSRGSAPGAAVCPGRRSGRWRCSRSATSQRRCRFRSPGWAASRAARMRATCSTWALRSSRWAPPASGTRWPPSGSSSSFEGWIP